MATDTPSGVMVKGFKKFCISDGMEVEEFGNVYSECEKGNRNGGQREEDEAK
jgi:hypothetical protein